MKTETVNITPSMASDWLKSNTDNRALRRSRVDAFKHALLRGEYIHTHQGIAFADKGALLIDGQHRLTAISELRDGSFPMQVTWDAPQEAFKVTDIGAKRSAADALKEEKRLVEAARLICVLCNTTNARCSPSPLMLTPYADRIREIHDGLLDAYGSATRTWSSAPVRVAAIVSIMNGADADYVKAMYRLLGKRDLDAMPPVGRSLFRSEAIGSVSATNSPDMIARCLVVFDKKRAQNKMIKVLDKASILALLRETFSEIVEQQAACIEPESSEKKAAKRVAAKGNSQGRLSHD